MKQKYQLETLLAKENLYAAMARGSVAGASIINKFGHNADVDIDTTPETVWLGGGLYPWQTSAVSLEVTSASAEDSTTGTGLHTIRVVGLDANWEAQEKTVTLNGTGRVKIEGTWMRVFRAYGLTCGSSNSNVGAITIQVQGLGDTQALMGADTGQTTLGLYTVPNKKQGLIVDYSAGITSGSGSAEAQIALMTRENDQAGRPFRQRSLIGISRAGSSVWTQDKKAPILIPPKTDIELRVVDVTVNSMAFVGLFTIILIDTDVP